MFSIFRNINQSAGKSKILDLFAIFCARSLVYLTIAFLFIEAVIWHSRGLFVYPIFSGLCAAFVFDRIIYFFYKEKRPAAFTSTNVLIPVPSNPSFPSRHASLLFGVSFYVLFYNPRLAIIFLMCACLVGAARVFCGVHWPRDILAGAVVGLISSWLLYILISFIR